jgi:hypothetical protein
MDELEAWSTPFDGQKLLRLERMEVRGFSLQLALRAPRMENSRSTYFFSFETVPHFQADIEDFDGNRWIDAVERFGPLFRIRHSVLVKTIQARVGNKHPVFDGFEYPWVHSIVVADHRVFSVVSLLPPAITVSPMVVDALDVPNSWREFIDG